MSVAERVECCVATNMQALSLAPARMRSPAWAAPIVASRHPAISPSPQAATLTNIQLRVSFRVKWLALYVHKVPSLPHPLQLQSPQLSLSPFCLSTVHHNNVCSGVWSGD